MSKGILLLAILFISSTVKARFSDNFNDGDYTINPTWQGSTSDFIINSNGQLQSNNSTPSAVFSITTANTSVQQTEWKFWTRIDFNPSSANYVDVWLASQLQDFYHSSNAGYFVRIGSTDDDICLYKKSAGSSAQKIIDGADGLLNTSSSVMKIKVICTAAGKWILLRDSGGTGNNFRSEGEISDGTITTSNFFGINIRQSTASFFNKHFFDDIVVKTFDEITTAPAILSMTAPTSGTVKITFDRPLSITSAEDVTHYFISGIGNPLSAIVDEANGSIVHLNFDGTFTPNEKKSILMNDIADVYGNTLTNVLHDFYFYKAARFDVVIDEIFPDPDPQVGLPSQKFIELKNNASFTVDLKDWRMSDGNNSAYLPEVEILPDSFLIITTSAGMEAYSGFGHAISVNNFPSLNISGGELVLYDATGSLMHAMNYNIDSYQNELKKEGGFTLEMINTKVGCVIEENWRASNAPLGGTPGSKNSVDENKSFEKSFQVMNAYLSAPDTLYVDINRSTDSVSAAKKENYVIDGGLTISAIELLPPFFNIIRITFLAPATEHKFYTIKVNGLSACDGSTLSDTKNSAAFALPEEATTNDIVINEILFDPAPGDVDFLELYNNSDKALDLKNIFIANRNSSGAPANFVQVHSTGKILFPGNFALLTTDPGITISSFPSGDKESFIKVSSLPSFPDDSGTAIVMNRQGDIIDEINYTKYWHFSLMKEREGISLERISYSGISGQMNFHSASTTLKGTPGYKNSQSTPDALNTGDFNLSHKIFSPDNDGTDDVLTINYEFPTPGYVTNIKIFDASGRMVRYLEKNSLSALKGYYRWDGLDDKSKKLPQGIYIIYFESFNESGKKMIHKKSVVLARRW